VQHTAGGEKTLSARWLVDASGRNRVLANQLHLQQAVKEQKSVFWFRLMNFDPEILSRIQALKKNKPGLRSLLRDSSFLWKGELDLVHPDALAGKCASHQHWHYLPSGRLSAWRGTHDGAVPGSSKGSPLRLLRRHGRRRFLQADVILTAKAF
jgi:hypothetical protein